MYKDREPSKQLPRIFNYYVIRKHPQEDIYQQWCCLQGTEPVILLRILGCQQSHGTMVVCDDSSLWQSIQMSIKSALKRVILQELIGLHATVASTSNQS